MRTPPPDNAVFAMLFLTVLAVGMVWAIETVTRLLR
jgi:hypothetical protein